MGKSVRLLFVMGVFGFLCVGPRAAFADSADVVRAEAGNWGLFFRAGGLANLTLEDDAPEVGAGDPGLIIAQVGGRAVLSENWIIPFHIGTGVRIVSTDGDDDNSDFGLDIGGGFEYHFRIWRRISPFVGTELRVGTVNPSGDDNWSVGFGIYPTVGVEYYIGDRVSLIFQYLLWLDMSFGDGVTAARLFNTRAGGALSASFYF